MNLSAPLDLSSDREALLDMVQRALDGKVDSKDSFLEEFIHTCNRREEKLQGVIRVNKDLQQVSVPRVCMSYVCDVTSSLRCFSINSDEHFVGCIPFIRCCKIFVTKPWLLFRQGFSVEFSYCPAERNFVENVSKMQLRCCAVLVRRCQAASCRVFKLPARRQVLLWPRKN